MLSRDLCNNSRVNSRMRIIAAVLLISLALGWRFRPRPLTDEDRIRRALQEARDAVQRRSVRDLMRIISDDYSDNEGNTKQTLRQIATAFLMQRQRLAVSLLIRKVDVQGDATATANVHVRIADPDAGNGEMDLQLEFTKEDGAWKVVRASGVNTAGGR